LDGITQDVSISPTTKGNETINNLFTLITKEDATLDHTKGQTQKGKYIIIYQDEEQDQRMLVKQ
jgi:hypothetical protein